MRRSTNPLPGVCVTLALLSACASAPPENKDQTAPGTAQPAAAAGAPTNTSGAKPTPGSAGAQGSVPPAASAPLPARATVDFARAVGYMRGGNATEAELEFKQMTLAYPSLSAPFVNLGILYRKGGHLDQSEDALKSAVERNGASAVAWNELGATQRMRGKFPDAAASYERAIAADANYAPAYRNLGVVSDLYLGDPERALTALERYKELTGEDRPVTSWIAELRQRTGKPPLKPANAPAPASGSNSGQGAPGTPAPAAPASPPATTPQGAAHESHAAGDFRPSDQHKPPEAGD